MISSQHVWQPGSLTNHFCQTAIWQVGWRSLWCPAFLTQISATWSARPILSEDCSWSFLAKYLQYGQSLFWEPPGFFSPMLYYRGQMESLYLSRCYSFIPAISQRDCCNHWLPGSLLKCACEDFRMVVKRSAVSLGSQVWVINFQCCCLTINEVMAPGPDWLYLSDVSHLPAGHSPLVRALH